MSIRQSPSKLQWNYFLALERDMELVSRYVEFSKPNLRTYSIELAHLLFAASSEVDAVAKLLCSQIAPAEARDRITDYKPILLRGIPDLPHTCVHVPRFGLTFEPWSKWSGVENPDWWRAYNSVKHDRDAHFNRATLQNALNALGGLLILACHYYARKLAADVSQPLQLRETTRQLEPGPTLLRLDDKHYYSHLVV